MHLATPLITLGLLTASALAATSASDTDFTFSGGGGGTTSATATSTDFNFGGGGPVLSASTTVTILDGFTVTQSGYTIGETQTPVKGEWTLDIHPHNTECLFGTNSYTFSHSSSMCFPHGGKSLYFHNKEKPKCKATTFSGRNCRGSSVADLRSDLCNWITFGSVNVTCVD